MSIVFKKETKKIDLKTKKSKIPFYKNKESLFYYFIFLVVLGFFFFITSLLSNQFTTPFGGDYCAQQFSFYLNGYDDWWHFFKTGEFRMFDTNTFLGSSNIGSNSFYYIFDPFFMPILLVPRYFVPQGMAILTIFKISLAGLVFYAYIRYMGASKRSAKIGGTAYAFSGWMAWFLWFNHFTEITICFPLILLGVEIVLKERKPCVLMLSLCLTGFTNFFFLVSLALSAAIYAMFRYFQRLKVNNAKTNWKILGLGIFAFIVGIGMCLTVVLPASMVALTSDRATDNTYLATLLESLKNGDISTFVRYLFSWSDATGQTYKAYYPFIEFFYPAMSDRGTPLTMLGYESYDNVAGSLFCYTPMIILLIPALIRSWKEKKYSHHIAALLFVIAVFTPFCYYLFFGFTQAYSRWLIFVTASLIAYVTLYLDKMKDDPKHYVLIGGVFTLAGVFGSAMLAHHIVDKYPNFSERVPITLVMVIEAIYICVIIAIIYLFYNKKYLEHILIGVISLEAILMGAFVIEGHGMSDYLTVNNGLNTNVQLYDVTKKINANDKTYFRAYSSIANDSAKNDGMRNGYNGLSFFHSVYNYKLNNFLRWSRLTQYKDGWSGSYVEKRQNLDTFLGVKYYFVQKDSLRYNELGEYTPNVPLDFVDVSDVYGNDEFLVYENKNHINFAFSYDEVGAFNSEYSEDGYFGNDSSNSSDSLESVLNEERYLKYGILDYQDVDKVIASSNGDIGKVEFNTTSFYPEDGHNLNISYTYKESYPYHMNYYHCYDLEHPEKDIVVRNQSIDWLINATKVYPKVDRPDENDLSYFMTLKKSNGDIFPYDPKGMTFYMHIPYTQSYKHDVYFIDDNDNLITYDRHNDVQTTTYYKEVRGFYIRPGVDENGNFIPAPKVKTIIIVPRYFGMYSFYSTMVETYTQYQETKINELKQYPIENIVYSTDKFTFETNYEKHRFIVTQMPFDEGWTVEYLSDNGKWEKLPTFMAQGGFVSFMSCKGPTKYRMTYYTPYLKIGGLLSSISVLLFGMTFMSFYYITRKKENEFTGKLI